MAALVVLAAVAAVVATLLGGGALDGGLLGGSTANVSADGPTGPDGDRPLHEHPERADQSLDRRTRDGLSLLVGTSLEESALQLSEGDYEQAREALQGQRGELEGLVEAAATTDGTGEIATAYGRLRATQQDLADEREAYVESRDAYREAREVGNETGARLQARALEDHLARIEQLHAATLEGYARLSNVTEYDFARAVEQTNETVAETRSEVATVREETFVETTLSVTAATGSVSYHDPLELDAQLLDANGDPVAGGELVLEDPGGTTAVTTDENGTAGLTHRPVLLPAGPGTVSVSFRPDPAEPYRSSRASANVTVGQVDGSLAVGAFPEAVAFGDTLVVTVRATTRGERVAGVPFDLWVGDVTAGNATGPGGTATLSTTVPAELAVGEQSVAVGAPGGNTAVAFDDVSGSLAVRESETTLDVQANRLGSGAVELSGRLTTADGAPVSNQSVVLSLGGERTVAVVTDESGRYGLTVDDPPGISFEAVASYTAAETNLESADGTSMVAAGGGDSGVERWVPWFDTLADAPLVALAAVAAAGLLALAGGVALLVRRRGRPDLVTPDRVDGTPESATEPGERLRTAREDLELRPGAATRLAYLVARRELEGEVDGPEAATHREFLAACASDGVDEETLGDIATLTRCHERAAFGPDAVGPSTAEVAVETAERLVASGRTEPASAG